ncbi:MAG: YifB family Mg chelatase-like AAA ATPase [Bacteroidales bacterium]|nr:YifB family Mg chelatase-like AAA ATPase [Bacteroidales bacterium]
MIVKTFGSCTYGIHAITITVEVSVEIGVNFYLVGLPDSAVKESQQRIASALGYYGYRIPGKRIIINMAPADIRKEGSAYDLTIAIGILAASGKVKADALGRFVIMGELSLDGKLKPVRGVLPITLEAKKQGFEGVLLPQSNASEAAVVDGIAVYGAQTIKEVVDFLNGTPMQPVRVDTQRLFTQAAYAGELDFSDVRGQENAKRALEIAAAGGHNVIMIGSPGSGKTMLAKRMPSILPPMTLEEALETTKIHSVSGKLPHDVPLMTSRPFRAPHHTISDVALVGGGSHPMPGEISLAHHGVLFLDELPEFKRSVLEVLRQPLEDRCVTVSRSKMSVEYPASFMFIAAMNPCPCGYYGHPDKKCACQPQRIQQYMHKISGPLLDRIDMHIFPYSIRQEELLGRKKGESSLQIRERVVKARKIQEARFKGIPGVYCNAQMGERLFRQYCDLDASGRQLLKHAMEKLGFSARAYNRILKVARTIADLDGQERILPQHLSEAVGYRNLDRENWGKEKP